MRHIRQKDILDSKIFTQKNDILNKEVIQWGYEYLISHGYTLKSHLPEIVISHPFFH